MTLFVDDEDLENFLPVNVGFTFANLEDDLTDSFNRYILNRIGKEQIIESLKTENADNETHKELIRLVKRANANLAFMIYFPSAKVSISDKGIFYPGKEGEGKQATDKDKEDLYKSIRAKGFQALEDMLAHLYANKDTFSIWKESDLYKKFNELFIRDAREFGPTIKGSYLVFLELYNFIEDVQIEVIEQQVNPIVLENLKTAIDEDTLTDNQLILLRKYIRPTIAYLALARAVSTGAVARDGSGAITIYTDNKLETEKPTIEKNNRWHADLTKAGNTRLSWLTDFIQKNAVEFGIELPTSVMDDFKPFRNESNWSINFF